MKHFYRGDIMLHFRVSKLVVSMLAVFGLMAGSNAYAAEYPSKPITIICPFGAGSASDLLLRTAMPFMEKAIGQSIVLDYKSGAAGVVGANYYTTLKPDGYTLVMYNQPHMILHEKFMKTAYKADDFAPLLGLNYGQDLLLVNADSPYKTFDELMDAMKKNPGKLTFGIPGFYTNRHLNYALFAKMLEQYGTRVTLVPFENGAKQMAALLGGQVDMVINTYGMMAQYEGRIRALASLTEKRLVDDVPTLKELGYDGVYGVGGSNFIFINAKAPKGIIHVLQERLAPLAKDPDLKKAMFDAGQQYDFAVFDYKECTALNNKFTDMVNKTESLLQSHAGK